MYENFPLRPFVKRKLFRPSTAPQPGSPFADFTLTSSSLINSNISSHESNVLSGREHRELELLQLHLGRLVS